MVAMMFATILRTDLEKWEQTNPKTIKMTLARPPTTNFKMTVNADYTVSTRTPLCL